MTQRSYGRRFAGAVASIGLVAFLTSSGLGRTPAVTLTQCQYLVKRANDGDSFHVSVNGKEYIFRLYFVDTPETTMEFRNRVRQQATYFKVTEDQSLRLGELAKQFTKENLIKPFTVRTRWENARGESKLSRYYAFIETANGDLGELLVENGLARVYGRAAQPGETATIRSEWDKLKRLEQKARNEKVGGWGASAGRLTARAKISESGKGVDEFDAFFHPEKLAQPSPVTAVQGGKLDINAATKEELENLPGVGEATADRIIDARPFSSADDLKKIKGIGSGKKYEQLRPYFR